MNYTYVFLTLFELTDPQTLLMIEVLTRSLKKGKILNTFLLLSELLHMNEGVTNPKNLTSNVFFNCNPSVSEQKQKI